jgi:hypothetical protein
MKYVVWALMTALVFGGFNSLAAKKVKKNQPSKVSKTVKPNAKANEKAKKAVAKAQAKKAAKKQAKAKKKQEPKVEEPVAEETREPASAEGPSDEGLAEDGPIGEPTGDQESMDDIPLDD